MNRASEPLLELLDDSGVAMNPTGIIFELGDRLDDPPGRSTIYRAIDSLISAGYIERPVEDKALYRITNRGREWLAGDRDAADDAPEE